MNSLPKITPELQEENIIANTMERIAELNALVDKESIPEGFELDEEGVWYLQEQGKKPPLKELICSPMMVTMYIRDHKNENHGRVLEFKDIDGHKHQWTMPSELLAGEGIKIIANLLNMGLWISSKRKSRDKLLEYITRCNPVRKARCVLQCGWFNNVFVLPAETIGYVQREKIIYQNPSIIESKNDVLGSLDEWKQQVATKACGNSRLVLAISASFAGPILHLIPFIKNNF